MQPIKTILFFLSITILFISACNTCREGIDSTTSISLRIINKTTRKNLLDYTVGSWTDSVRIREIKTKQIAAQKPGSDGSMLLSFFDESNDVDAISTLKNKKYIINLQYNRDTFDVFFKMKESKCKDYQIETMRIKYKDSTYYYTTDNPTFIFVKP
jgi:hypothetical protein